MLKFSDSGIKMIIILGVFLIIAFQKLYSYGIEPVYGKNGMVASTNEIASRVGVNILKQGGNAVDAAVAVGFALAVVHPQAGNIGGGGFMLIRTGADGKVYALDYRETAPLTAKADMYLKEDGSVDEEKIQLGYLAVGTPGTVRGLAEAHKKFGLLKWKDVLQPAINLAEEGFPVNYGLACSMNSAKDFFSRFPSSRVFISDKQGGWEMGDLLVQKDLAATIRRIAEMGPDEFYTGATSRKIISAIHSGGGLLSEKDFEAYKAVWREPVIGEFNGYRIYGMPLPSSGGIVLMQSLNMLKHFRFTDFGYGSSDYYHILSEVMKRSFRDRAVLMGDPDFVDVPVDKLLSESYAEEMAKSISLERATPSDGLGGNAAISSESEQTTHFSIIDRWGNAVANTYTLNSSFGSKVVAEGTGVLLNNEMDDFSPKPGAPNQYGLIGSTANSIAPAKRMLSSMAPTIIVKDDETIIVLGSPGGPTIVSAVLQTLLNSIVFEMNIQEAVNAPRIHHQWIPDQIYFEKLGFAPEVKKLLEKKGHKIGQKDYMGDLQVVQYLIKKGIFMGASDPRMEGKPAGY